MGDVCIARRRQAVEAERAVRPGGEHAVEPERVKVYVELEAAPKALHDGDRAALPHGDAGTLAAPTVPAEHGANEHTHHGAAEGRSEEHTSELQSRLHLVCRLLLEKKK